MSVNERISKVLIEMGEILTIKGDRFRSRAFNMAAQRITALTEDIQLIYDRIELEDIPGVGKGIAAVITEVLERGGSTQLEELRESLPHGVRDLMQLEGVGPRKAMRLNKELGVTSIDELEQAAKEKKVRPLKGFGAKTEENLLRSIREYQLMQGRFLLGAVLPVIDDIIKWMKESPAVLQVEVAGSARRRKETVGDLDVLVASNTPEVVTERFVSMPPIIRIVAKGPTKSTVVLEKNLHVDLRVIEQRNYGAALQYFTGSKEHNVKLRTISVKRGYKLNEYGLYKRESGELVAGESEEGIYRILDMDLMPPELRENRGEIEAAMNKELPMLVEYSDIRGDLHVHTNWSDGNSTVEEMAVRAKMYGWEYLAICDHSKSLGIAGGLDEEDLRKQITEIELVNRKLEDITVLKGLECDIKADGSLDLPDRSLQDLDFVVASIHSGFKATPEKMTERLVSALHNEYVSTIGHPTGRVLQRRPGYTFDMAQIFETASEQGVMMEVNAYPDRLDLNDVNCMAAMENGVTLSIGTDSHSPSHMDFMEMGVSVARRGWLKKEDIINTLSIKDLMKVLRH